MRSRILSFVLILVICSSAGLFAGEAKAQNPTASAKDASPDTQVMALESMCAATSEARAGRQSQKTLYERLGKEKGIHNLTDEVVRLHLKNDDIKHLLDGVDSDKLADDVALFLISGTGGPSVYDGPSLTDSHRHMNLTNADFMAAGNDIVQAMKNLGYGQNEIDELVCAFVGLRGMLVLADGTAN